MPGVGEAPFTPSSNPLEPQRIAITVLNTGTVTQRMHRCSAGQMMGMRGPFGKGYPIEKTHGKEVLVVGGGVGLAPLRALILALLNEIDKIPRLSIKYGARCMEELLYRDQHEQWARTDKVDFTCTIDNPQDGWSGHTGVVTTLLESFDYDVADAYVVSCGPLIMLRFVTLTCLNAGFKPEHIYLSMNRKMSCGLGKCGRCNIGPYYLCKDGPDVCYDTIKDYKDAFSL